MMFVQSIMGNEPLYGFVGSEIKHSLRREAVLLALLSNVDIGPQNMMMLIMITVMIINPALD